MISLRNKRWLVCLSLSLLLVLTGCQGSGQRLRAADLPNAVLEDLRELQAGAGAAFRVDPESGYGYLQISTGADNQHLRLLEMGLDHVTRDNVLIVRVTQYDPMSNPLSSQSSDPENRLLLLRAKVVDFRSIRVEISGTSGGETIYELDI